MAPLSCVLICTIQLLAACQHEPIEFDTANRVPIDLGKQNEEQLLRYYFGGYVSPSGGDPVEAGLLLIDDGFAINPQLLDAGLRRALKDADGDGEIGWDEFIAFVGATYADARGLPLEIETFRDASDWSTESDAWFSVEVDGVMTEARRRVYVQNSALRAALEGFNEAGDRILYEPGTLIVGEHLDGDRVLETTLKRRRHDGFWDFAVYDLNGDLTSHTATGPRPLRAPVQCVGCHLGRRTFDPEKSFPAEASDGPFGPRALYVSDNLRNAEITAHFNEHAKRSDGVLGLYATLYTAQLVADRDAGILSEEDRTLLEGLGL